VATETSEITVVTITFSRGRLTYVHVRCGHIA